MTRFLSNRDGGKTDEKGHLKFLQSLTSGDIFSGGVVSQNGTPNMTVNIAAIDGLVRDPANGYAYHIWSDATENVQIATANSSNPRKDYIIAYVDRLAAVSTVNANNPSIWKLISVAGTPAGSPVYPTAAQIQATEVGTNPYIIIAGISIAAATTTITDGAIADLRYFVGVNLGAPNSVPTSALQAKAVTGAKVADNTITYLNLLATLFSGQVVGYSSQGGSFYRVNLGGIKILWGQTGNIATNASFNGLDIAFPANFFTRIEMALANVSDMTSVGEQYGNVAATPSVSATTIPIRVVKTFNSGNAASARINLLVIGT